MLLSSGGKNRIESFAKSHGQIVDTDRLHQTKSGIFQESLRASPMRPRPGLIQLVENAKARGMKVGLATTTERSTVSTLLSSLRSDSSIDFDVTTSRENGFSAKPSSHVFDHVLKELACNSRDVIAIEDNSNFLRSAKAARIWTVGFAGANVSVDDLKDADLIAVDNINDAIPSHFLNALSSNIFPLRTVQTNEKRTNKLLMSTRCKRLARPQHVNSMAVLSVF